MIGIGPYNMSQESGSSTDVLMNSIPSGMSGSAGSATIQDAIDQLFASQSGWKYSSSISLGTGNAIQISGIPASANEIEIFLNGISPSSTCNLCLQLVDSSYNIIAGSQYYSTSSKINNGSSPNNISGNPLTYFYLANGLAASDFISGNIRLRRAVNGGWEFSGFCMNSGTSVSWLSVGVGPVGDLSGVKLLLSSGNFDAGSTRVAWRS